MIWKRLLIRPRDIMHNSWYVVKSHKIIPRQVGKWYERSRSPTVDINFSQPNFTISHRFLTIFFVILNKMSPTKQPRNYISLKFNCAYHNNCHKKYIIVNFYVCKIWIIFKDHTYFHMFKYAYITITIQTVIVYL